jgi:hypothetical protein
MNDVFKMYPKVDKKIGLFLNGLIPELSIPSLISENLLFLEIGVASINHKKISSYHLNENKRLVKDDSLDVYLREIEKKYGFEEISYIFRNEEKKKLKKIEFSNFVSRNPIFYDYGIGKEHGEISHRIQIFFLLKKISCDLKLSLNQIDIKPFKIIQELVKENNTRKYIPLDGRKPYFKYLWTDLFDHGHISMKDARSPLWLNTVLMTGIYSKECKIISKSLQKRFNLRIK